MKSVVSMFMASNLITSTNQVLHSGLQPRDGPFVAPLPVDPNRDDDCSDSGAANDRAPSLPVRSSPLKVSIAPRPDVYQFVGTPRELLRCWRRHRTYR